MSEQEILESLLEKACSLPPAEIPAFLGGLETARVTALARLQSPAPAVKVTALDQMLTAKEASEILKVSPSWLYHQRDLPFAVRIPGCRSLKFSSNGIRKYLEQQSNNRK